MRTLTLTPENTKKYNGNRNCNKDCTRLVASSVEEDDVQSEDGVQPLGLPLVQLVHVLGDVIAGRVAVALCHGMSRLALQTQLAQHVRHLLLQRLQLHDVLVVAVAHPAQTLLPAHTELRLESGLVCTRGARSCYGSRTSGQTCA